MNKIFGFIKRYSKILFVVYMMLVILVLVLKFPTGMVSGTVRQWLDGEEVVRITPKLIPFDTIIAYARNVQVVSDWFFKNLACNLVMFIPHGFLLPLFIKECKHPVVKVILYVAMISVCIEVFQYIAALGVCDIDDVILNVISAMFGYVIYHFVYSRFNK